MFSIPTESCKIHIIISYLLRNIIIVLFDNVGWDEEDVAEDDEEVLFNTGEFDFRAAEYSDGGRCGGDRSNIDGDDGGGRAEVDDDDDEDLDEE